jgi:hypothetical protein
MWQGGGGAGNVHGGFWWGDTMQRNNLEELVIDVKIII